MSGNQEILNNRLFEILHSITAPDADPNLIPSRLADFEQAIEDGADVNALHSFNNMSILSSAASNGILDIVKILIRKGADINSIDERNRFNALHYASLSGCSNVIEFLIDNGLNIEQEEIRRKTPLHLAALGQSLSRRPDAIQTLLDRGANINSFDEEGKTPLNNVADCVMNEDYYTKIKDATILLLQNGATFKQCDLVFCNNNGNMQPETNFLDWIRERLNQWNVKITLVQDETTGYYFKKGFENLPEKTLATTREKITRAASDNSLNFSENNIIIPKTAMASFVEKLGVEETVKLSEVSKSFNLGVSSFLTLAKETFSSVKSGPFNYERMCALMFKDTFRDLVRKQQEQEKAQEKQKQLPHVRRR